MATIRIADPAYPLHRTESVGRGSIPAATNDGIYNMRAISRASSRDGGRRSAKFDIETEGQDDDPGLRQSGEYKTKQVWIDPPPYSSSGFLRAAGLQW